MHQEVTKPSKTKVKARISLLWSCLRQFTLPCTTSLSIPAVWTHDNCINPARSWKPSARFEEHTGMELSQRMANLNPQLSKKKGRAIDLLSLEHKASKGTIFIQTNSVQTQCCVVRNSDSIFFSRPTMGKKCRQWNTVDLEILLLSDLSTLIINFKKGKR